MKKFLLVISLVFALFGLVGCANAAPAPTLFVYNNTTKECGTFRDGDEYVSYDLPNTWQTYDYDISTAKSTQEYCDELGYKNIGNVVTYLNLQPKYSALKRPDYNSKPQHFNYSLLIILILVFTATTIVGLIMLSYKHSKKSE